MNMVRKPPTQSENSFGVTRVFLENSIFLILSNHLAPLNNTHLDPKIAVQNEMKEKKYK